METGTKKSITIKFSAPGEDLDWGTASGYEIRYSTVRSDVRGGNSTIVLPERVVDGSLQPLEFGSRQIIKFLLEDDNDKAKTYFVAVRSIDRTGQFSPISNIVTALFISCPAKCLSTYKNFCWEETRFNTTAHNNCPYNFEGMSSWICGADGQWLNPSPDLRYGIY